MVTQRTVDVANDNDDMSGTDAMQPAASEDVRIDDVMQPMNGNEHDVIFIPEAMIDGIYGLPAVDDVNSSVVSATFITVTRPHYLFCRNHAAAIARQKQNSYNK